MTCFDCQQIGIFGLVAVYWLQQLDSGQQRVSDMSKSKSDINTAQQLDAAQIEEGIRRHLEQSLGVEESEAGPAEYWKALSLVTRDITLEKTRLTRRKGK